MEGEGPLYPRLTPRHTIVMADEVWNPLMELARRRGENTSTLIRRLAIAELASARAAGEIPKVYRKKKESA